MKKQPKLPWQLAWILAAATIFTIGCGDQQNSPPQATPPKVKVKQLERVTERNSFKTAGTVTTQQQVKLSFKKGGIIKTILTAEGRSVKQGELLAQLNLAEHESKLIQAQTAHDKSIRDQERIENLHKDSVATLEQLQDARSNLDVHKSNLRIAQFNLEYASIKAPRAGKIVKQLAEEGELIGQGMPVFIFSSSGENWVFKAGISESQLAQISIGDSVSVSMNVFPGNPIPAHVMLTPQSIDPQASSYEIEIELAHNNLKMVSGYTGKAEVFTMSRTTYFKLPPKALIESTDGTGAVYHVKGEPPLAKREDVKIVKIGKDFIGVSAEFLEVAQVIVERQVQLKTGQQVEVLNQK